MPMIPIESPNSPRIAAVSKYNPRMRYLLSFVLAAVLMPASLAAAPKAPCPPSTVSGINILDVTVIDVVTGAEQRHMTVKLTGERITEIVPYKSDQRDECTKVVEAAGKYLIPGLWDMHVHTFFGTWVPGGREVTIPLYAANGITGVRDMGSELDLILQARADIASGKLIGPRMIVAGPMLDGPKTQFPASIAVATPEDGRRAVDMLVSRGVDFIKIQSYVPRDAYFAIADECKKKGITFVGHVPDAIRASEASNAGQKSFEHLIGIFEGSSTAEDELLTSPKTPGRFLETYDPQKEAALIALLAKNQTWQCPTLFWERGQWLVDAIDIRNDPDAKYVPAYWREKTWPHFTESIIKELDTDPLPVREKFVEHELDIVRKLQAAGVPLIAGTDTPAGVDVIPGASLHHELQRFVDAGFTPLQALQTATINPAQFLGITKDFGVVAPGKIADLVLLDADPTENIGNTRKIAGVFLNGRYFESGRLYKIVEQGKQKIDEKRD
ncbi:MAG TPA: amidohydrolase family protein [Candidatus Acidoferrales bacterium]